MRGSGEEVNSGFGLHDARHEHTLALHRKGLVVEGHANVGSSCCMPLRDEGRVPRSHCCLWPRFHSVLTDEDGSKASSEPQGDGDEQFNEASSRCFHVLEGSVELTPIASAANPSGLPSASPMSFLQEECAICPADPVGAWLFLFFHALGSMGVGVATVAAPMFNAEIAPPEVQKRLTGMFQLWVVFNILVAFISNTIIAASLSKTWLGDGCVASRHAQQRSTGARYLGCR